MSQYEIEIKSLLGTKDAADALVNKMKLMDNDLKEISRNSQLNHYFTDGDINKLYVAVSSLFSNEQDERFKTIAEKGSDFSVRTRQKDEEILLVVKASLDGGTSSNTVSRMEFEEPVAVSLSQLDELILGSGYQYQAKWSRDRIEYDYKGLVVCIDKNAGYGYLAEFEKVTDNEASLPDVRANLEKLMVELGVEELNQDRLARMFAYYNEFWPDYYGTEKVFSVE